MCSPVGFFGLTTYPTAPIPKLTPPLHCNTARTVSADSGTAADATRAARPVKPAIAEVKARSVDSELTSDSNTSLTEGVSSGATTDAILANPQFQEYISIESYFPNLRSRAEYEFTAEIKSSFSNSGQSFSKNTHSL